MAMMSMTKASQAWTRRLIEAAGNVTSGVPIATPVFDGAKEADVNDALRAQAFDTSVSRSCLMVAQASSLPVR